MRRFISEATYATTVRASTRSTETELLEALRRCLIGGGGSGGGGGGKVLIAVSGARSASFALCACSPTAATCHRKQQILVMRGRPD